MRAFLARGKKQVGPRYSRCYIHQPSGIHGNALRTKFEYWLSNRRVYFSSVSWHDRNSIFK